MIGLGTIVNAVSILAGGLIGSLLKSFIPERYRGTIMQAVGLSVIIIGLSGSLQGMYKVTENRLSRDFILIMIFSLIIGAICGEFLKIDKRLDDLGNWFQDRFAKEGSSFSEGFVTASLLFCVGAMAIVGSLEDGLTGERGTLYAKSILDGISSVIISSTLGIGVAFAAIPILLYQGAITLLAGSIRQWLTPDVISQTSLVGSILILAIGINLLEIKKINVANLLPAIFVPFFYYLALFYINDLLKLFN
ncbi:MAG TPA: DUF554 domain-containing protein [Spirochaetota bacterium]|jgi:uncharacterized membrane protein YqgA involved in biofilm formation|nr:DUF554 domain-containing protein [Spirochaetota bacterium]OQA98668.1 MAG: putative membrane protein YdfK [Spirochaetes bacterium ADurb.Bin218]HOK02562.1 DUF554 domain-containing protein [Spirochaetota bacterium]HOK93651.1 DUF554 domain-containing protein [Spirochaetota bacterium]HON16804.1 DUF554 domain-containing protein [Spirochaetota bacterium]